MTIQENLNTLKQHIAVNTAEMGRNLADVTVLAVTKGQSIAMMREAFAAGIRDFGENYWQEARTKIQELRALPITWHFIGQLQRNKLKAIATQFAWVHSVYRAEELVLLNAHRAPHLPPLNICLQVHTRHALRHRGVDEPVLSVLVDQAVALQHIQLRGFMLMLSPHLEEAEQYDAFCEVRDRLAVFNQTKELQLDTLSMGMSADMRAAIRAGSTLIRIGRKLFKGYDLS